jgi:iron complex transport system substrate-binding protein
MTLGIGRWQRPGGGIAPRGCGRRETAVARATLAVTWALAGLALGGCREQARRGAAGGAAGVSVDGAAERPVLEAVDERGRVVRLAREPGRIVSLLPSHTETLFALGVGDRIVGRDAASDRPAAVLARPSVGGVAGLSVEAVLALAPDVVLASENAEQAAALEAVGLAVWAGSSKTYDEVFATLGAFGRLTGRAVEAAALAARLRGEVDEVAARVAGRPKVRVYYEIDPTPYSVGPRSFVGVLLAKAGGETVAPGSLGDYPRLAPEEVFARDPDVILGVTLDEARARPGWGRLGALEGDERAAVVRPGPRVAEGVRALARRLHPGALP